MNTKDQDIANVKKLYHGEHCTVGQSEGGGGEVYRIWNTYFLFSIPQYGGEGNFERAFTSTQIEQLVDNAHSWT